VRRFVLPVLLLGVVMVIGLPGCGPPSAADSPAPAAADSVAPSPEDGTRLLVVRNGTLIDGTGAVPLADAVIVIEDGRILEIGAAGGITIPTNAEVVDAGGGTILPGLVDTHTHLLQNLLSTRGTLDPTAVDYYLETALAAGVTTFRDAGSKFGFTESLPDLRRSLDALGVPLPTIVATGPVIAAEGNYAATAFAANTIAVSDVPEAVAAVQAALDGGADQIKVMVDHWESEGDPTPSLTAEQLAAITDAAHRRDAWVLAHVTDIADAWMAIDGGVDELTHWPGHERLPDDLIEAIVDRGVVVGTTFGLPDLRPFDGDLRRLLDSGGTIVVSTDAPGVMRTSELWVEMARMIEFGMTPMEAIVAATSDAARAVGRFDAGTIEIGRVADLVIVNGNPLDDIGVVADISLVIKDGVASSGS